jgi:hypothetical protein
MVVVDGRMVQKDKPKKCTRQVTTWFDRVQKDKLKNGLDKANLGEVFNSSLPLLTN